jgi:hypothetical protein
MDYPRGALRPLQTSGASIVERKGVHRRDGKRFSGSWSPFSGGSQDVNQGQVVPRKTSGFAAPGLRTLVTALRSARAR